MGRRTLTSRFALPLANSIQRRTVGSQHETNTIHRVAAEGVHGTGSALPFRDQIQRSFGRHDIDHIEAYCGPNAAVATEQIGAAAYATGNKVAFGGSIDLHTAAHEAAHVVQQQAGVSLLGGVGQVGDRYEHHADRVADLVVKGQSAEAELDTMAGASSTGVQCAPAFVATAPNPESQTIKELQKRLYREGIGPFRSWFESGKTLHCELKSIHDDQWLVTGLSEGVAQNKQSLLSAYNWITGNTQEEFVDDRIGLPDLAMWDKVGGLLQAADAAVARIGSSGIGSIEHDLEAVVSAIHAAQAEYERCYRRITEYRDRVIGGAELAANGLQGVVTVCGVVETICTGGLAAGAGMSLVGVSGVVGATAGANKVVFGGAQRAAEVNAGVRKDLDIADLLEEAGQEAVLGFIGTFLGGKLSEAFLANMGPRLLKALPPEVQRALLTTFGEDASALRLGEVLVPGSPLWVRFSKFVVDFLGGAGISGLTAAIANVIQMVKSGEAISTSEFIDRVVQATIEGGVVNLFIMGIFHGAGTVKARTRDESPSLARDSSDATPPPEQSENPNTTPSPPHDANQPQPTEMPVDLGRRLQRPSSQELVDKALAPDLHGPLATEESLRQGQQLPDVPPGMIRLVDGSLAADRGHPLSEQARAWLAARRAERSELGSSPRKVVVDGGGPTGALTALQAFLRGHDVTIVEMRDNATLPILWLNRPETRNILEAIDPVLAGRMFNGENAGEVKFGEAIGLDGVRHVKRVPEMGVADPTRATGDPRAIAGQVSSFHTQNATEVNLIWARLAELATIEEAAAAREGRQPRLNLMRGYEVKSLPVDGNRRQVVVQEVIQVIQKLGADGKPVLDATGKPIQLPYTEGMVIPDGYSTKPTRGTDGVDINLGTPDDLLVADGAGSKARAMAGAESLDVGPSARYMAGYFTGAPLRSAPDVNGKVIQGGNRYRIDVDSQGNPIHTVAGTSSLNDGTWALPEIDSGLNLDNPRSIEAYFGQPMSKKAAVLAYYKQQVARVLEVDPAAIRDDAFVMEPSPFVVQSHVSSGVAADASNVHLIGDARGNSHFFASLGKVTGTGTHQMALGQYWQALAWGLDPDVARALLDRRLDAGTRVWLKSGLPSFTDPTKPPPSTLANTPEAGERSPDTTPR